MVIEAVSTATTTCERSEYLGDALAVMSSVSQENPEAFRKGLLGWVEWSNIKPELGAIALVDTSLLFSTAGPSW